LPEKRHIVIRSIRGWLLIWAAAGFGFAQTQIDLRMQARNVDFSTARSTRPSKTGTVLPTACAVGETFFKSDAPAGKNQYGCTATDTWTLQGGDALPAMAGNADTVLSTDGTNGQWRALGGDLRGKPEAVTVTGIQGRGVAANSPADGNVLQWNATAGQWMPSLPPSAPPNYVTTFSAATLVAVAGTAHGFATANLLVDCYDNSTPPQRVETDQVTIDAVTRNVTIRFSTAQTGYCVINGGAGGAGGGPVSLGGDVTGSTSNTTVSRIQNRPVAAAAPSDGQALVWNAAAGSWQPQAVATNNVSMSAQLGDLNVVRTSGTTLTIGAGCSAATPCNVRFGGTVYSIKNGATATLTSGDGIAYIYISPGGVITVGHNVSLTCSSGCAAVTGITAFPADVIPVFTWTALGGVWEASGGSDQRAWLGAKVLNSGAGIAISETSGQTVVGVDTATVPTYTTGSAVLDFPAIPNSGCAAEQTFSVPGAATGDAVAAGWPAGLETGLIGMMRVNEAGSVAVRLCNFSGASVDPAIATFRATIVRNF